MSWNGVKSPWRGRGMSRYRPPMKLPDTRIPTLALPLALFLLLGSCSSTAPGGKLRRVAGGGAQAEGVATPRVEPADSYYHQGRYYVGGRYETGRYVHDGQTYGNRYLHNSHYLYGGSLREYPNDGSGQIRGTRSTGAGYVSYTTPPLKKNRPVAYYTDR